MEFLRRTKPKTNFQQYFKTMAQRYLIVYILQICLTFSSQTLGRKLQTVLIIILFATFQGDDVTSECDALRPEEEYAKYSEASH